MSLKGVYRRKRSKSHGVRIRPSASWFEIWLIPETRRASTLDAKDVGDRVNIEIERGTQVIVDTVPDTVTEALGELRPALDALLRDRSLTFDDLITPSTMLPRPH